MTLLPGRPLLLLAMALCACSRSAWDRWVTTGSLYRSPTMRVGVRPHLECGAVGCDGAAISVRVER